MAKADGSTNNPTESDGAQVLADRFKQLIGEQQLCLERLAQAQQAVLAELASTCDLEPSALGIEAAVTLRANETVDQMTPEAAHLGEGHDRLTQWTVDMRREDVFRAQSSCKLSASRDSFKPTNSWYSVRDCWQTVPDPRWPPLRQETRVRTSESAVLDFQQEVIAEHGSLACVCFPNSALRLAWDVVGAVLLAYDLIVIPLTVFSHFTDPVFVLMDWVTLLFWTSDIIFAFFTGYVDKGRTILNHRKIAKHYLSTWFALDFLVVVPDWIFTFASFSSGDFFKTLRVIRIIRMVRLVRIAKLRRVLVQLQDHVNSEYMSVILAIVKQFLLMLVVNHVIGCIWYWIGDIGRDLNSPNWIEKHDLQARTLYYVYFTAMHWSVTQFTPGSMHVQPHNLGERIFSVIVLLAGMVVFSFFISSITAAMTALRNLQEDSWKQTWLLRRYLRERGVPQRLNFRIQRYAEWQYTKTKDGVPEVKVQLLSVLSDQLREELRVFTVLRPLQEHQLFRGSGDHIYARTLQNLASMAAVKKSVALGDSLFYPSEPASCMMSLLSGKLLYRVDESALVSHGRKASVDSESFSLRYRNEAHANWERSVLPEAGDWICENSLWTEWFHCGQLQAVQECELIFVNAVGFSQVIRNDPTAWHHVQQYAKKFVQWLNEVAQTDVCDDITPKFTLPRMSVHTATHAGLKTGRESSAHLVMQSIRRLHIALPRPL